MGLRGRARSARSSRSRQDATRAEVVEDGQGASEAAFAATASGVPGTGSRRHGADRVRLRDGRGRCGAVLASQGTRAREGRASGGRRAHAARRAQRGRLAGLAAPRSEPGRGRRCHPAGRRARRRARDRSARADRHRPGRGPRRCVLCHRQLPRGERRAQLARRQRPRAPGPGPAPSVAQRAPDAVGRRPPAGHGDVGFEREDRRRRQRPHRLRRPDAVDARLGSGSRGWPLQRRLERLHAGGQRPGRGLCCPAERPQRRVQLRTWR